jgi:hypothetical protein
MEDEESGFVGSKLEPVINNMGMTPEIMKHLWKLKPSYIIFCIAE